MEIQNYLPILEVSRRIFIIIFLYYLMVYLLCNSTEYTSNVFDLIECMLGTKSNKSTKMQLKALWVFQINQDGTTFRQIV